MLRQIATHPANQGRVWAALAGYFRWQISKRVLGARYRDVGFHGLTLRCFADSHSASAALYFNALPDYREMCFMQRYLRPGDAFLDVGANVGVYTLLAAALVGPRGHVDAFEPGEKAQRYLRQNVELNALEQVSIHPFALAERSQEWDLLRTQDDCTASLAVSAADRSEATTRVICKTLDEFAPEASWAMAKLDVEGAEPLVLRGARAHLARGNPPVLQIEMDGHSKRYGVQTHDFIEELRGLRYRTAIFDPAANEIIACQRPWEQDLRNVLAVHEPDWSEVTARLQERFH